jgi:hypothetical protein
MANPKTPITELDFEGIKSQLKTYLAQQAQFKDYNFEGSNMAALLDVLAFNTFQNNFYTNMAINEMFLDSAVIKNSVVSHAKELNYIPRSRRSAKATIRLVITAPDEENSTITIPTYSSFSSSYQGETFNFVTEQTYVARKNIDPITREVTFIAENVDIFEGQMLTSFQREGFIIDADGVLRVYLSNNEVDTNSIVVFVDAEATEDQNVFTRATTIYGVKPTDRVFYIEPYYDDRYSIYFGKNEFGLQPQEFEDVRVRYRICSGNESNGASQFSAGFLENATIECQTTTAAAGGEERESIESIRYFAPKALQIQERACTTKDYEILLQQKFPEIKAVAAYGGEDLDPPQFGKVAISVYLDSTTQLISSTLSNAFIAYLSEKSPLGIEPVFVQTKFIYAELSVDTIFTLKETEKNASQLESSVRQIVQAYSDNNLENFNTSLRKSRLASQIDSIDTAIQSTSIIVTPYIEYAPILNVRTAPSFNFEAELVRPYPFRAANGFSGYKPAVTSTPFDVNGVCVYLQDDGMGNIMTVTDDATDPQVVNPTAGKVNYNTGNVVLSNFIVEEYTGSAIKIKANIKSSDVKSPQGRVFLLRDEDIFVSVLEESAMATGTSSSSTIGTLQTTGSSSGSSSSSGGGY